MNIQKMEDDELMIRSQAGDTSSFGVLYLRYLDGIYHYVFYRVNHREEAEDLTEAIFLRAWQALDKNPPREAPFRLWLYRIAHNVIIDHYRIRKKQVGLEAVAQLPHPREGIEASIAREEQIGIMKEALLKLKDEHQQVLSCRFIAGLTHAETAVIMARKEDAVRALQYRAIVALRQILLLEEASNYE